MKEKRWHVSAVKKAGFMRMKVCVDEILTRLMIIENYPTIYSVKPDVLCNRLK